MKKSTLVIFILGISLAISGVVLHCNSKYPSIGEWVQADINSEINSEDCEKILNIMSLQNTDIYIDTIAYEVPFRHESSYRITFCADNLQKGNLNSNMKILEEVNGKLYIKYEKVVLNTSDSDFKTVKAICDKYY